MDTGGVVRRVQRSYGDSAEIQILKADIYDWINDAQKEITRQTECLVGRYHYSPASSPTSYTTGFTLPSDFIRVKRVSFDGFPALTETTIEDLDSKGLTAPGTDSLNQQPTHYYKLGSRLYVWPTPVQVGSNLIELTYIQIPLEVADDEDLLTIPESMHEDIVRYCLARAHELNENFAAANKFQSEMENRLAISKSEQMQPADSYAVVRDDTGDLW